MPLLASPGLSGPSWRLFLRIRRSLHRHTAYTFELRATSAAGKSLEPPLPARGELASNAVLRSSLAQTLASISVDTEIEMHGAALRHR